MTLHISEQSDVDALQAALQAQLDDHEVRLTTQEKVSYTREAAANDAAKRVQAYQEKLDRVATDIVKIREAVADIRARIPSQ